jgi:hypothetical protein
MNSRDAIYGVFGYQIYLVMLYHSEVNTAKKGIEIGH